ERALVDQLAHLAGVKAAPFGNAAHQLLEDRMQQRVGLLAMRRRHLRLGQDVHRGLVLGAMIEARLDAELVERAAEERRLDAQADQPDLAEGLQPQLVEGRAQVIGARAGAELAEAVGITESELALGAKGGDGVAQLLDLRRAGLACAEARHQPLDAWIVAGALERVEHVAEIALFAEKDALHAAMGWGLG